MDVRQGKTTDFWQGHYCYISGWDLSRSKNKDWSDGWAHAKDNGWAHGFKPKGNVRSI